MEHGFDGGAVRVRLNGGDWQYVQARDIYFNSYSGTLLTAAQGNANPYAGLDTYTGSDPGQVIGKWAWSYVDLGRYCRIQQDRKRIPFSCGGMSELTSAPVRLAGMWTTWNSSHVVRIAETERKSTITQGYGESRAPFRFPAQVLVSEERDRLPDYDRREF
jgi:hypothetical protein